MSIKKVMTMFALLMGIACATYAQGVTNDSTATAKEDGLELVKDVYPQTEEDGDLYHGLTKKLMFDRMIPPHGLEVTYDKTVHILFPAAVRYVDLGSPNLIAGKADGAENVIRVKATVRDFRSETNMSVITEDGSFYTFNVKYADEPLILNVEMKDFIHDGSTVNRPNNAQEIYLKELGSESPMLVHLIMKSLHKEDKRKVKHIGCKRFGIQYILKGIYVHNGLLYFHTEIKNQSNVPFRCGLHHVQDCGQESGEAHRHAGAGAVPAPRLQLRRPCSREAVRTHGVLPPEVHHPRRQADSWWR